MEKTLSTALVLVVFVAVFAAMLSVPPKGNKKVEDQIRKRVVKIMTIDGAQEWQGSGTLVGNNHILTNSHLFPPEYNEYPTIVFKRYDDTEFYPAVVISSNTAADYAILKFKGPDATKPLPYTFKWKIGDPVILMGNPLRKDFETSQSKIIGSVYGFNPMFYVRNMIMVECAEDMGGYSGSGVYNYNGQYLGIFELRNGLFPICYVMPVKELAEEGLTNPHYGENK